MSPQYVEERNGALWVTGTRASLDSIVYQFKDGASPECIQQSFSLLTLEQVYGAITYLGNRDAVDAYLAQGEQQHAAFRELQRRANPDLVGRMERARQALADRG